jgi:hypothetical protein
MVDRKQNRKEILFEGLSEDEILALPAGEKAQSQSRSGWAEASSNVAATGDDALVVPEFANESYEKVKW